METLKSCPFCGQSHTLKITAASELFADEDEEVPYMHSETYAVICDASKPKGPGGRGGQAGFHDTEAEAIEAWNRRAAIQQAAGAVPEGCRIVPIEPTESMLVFVHRLAWINAVNATPSPLGREAGSSDHLVPCAGGGVQGRGWCQYIAGMVECYLKTDHSTEDREAAIAGIIERRLHRLPAFCDVIAPRPDAPTGQMSMSMFASKADYDKAAVPQPRCVRDAHE